MLDLGQLYEQHAPALKNYIRRRVDPLDAEDVCQEVFVDALEHQATYAERGLARAWLYRIARSRIGDARRVARRRPPALPIELWAGETPGPEVTTDARLALAEGLAAMNDRQRRAFVLHGLRDLPLDAAAAQLGITRRPFKALYHRACMKVRAAYTEEQ